MCRWIAYAGGPVYLEELLFKPKHSLIDQSLAACAGETTTNGDGFGVGWYGNGQAPGLYKGIQPAWSDENLLDLASQIKSPMFMAHVRSTTGTAIQRTNCHPFRHGRWLFQHNGAISDFPEVKRDLVLAISPSLFPEISGSTDSGDHVLSRADIWIGGRPCRRGRKDDWCHRGCGSQARCEPPAPDDSGDPGWRDTLCFPILQRRQVTNSLLQREHRCHAAAISGRACIFRRRACRGLRTAWRN